jgi:ribosomal protein L37AE/L43A
METMFCRMKNGHETYPHTGRTTRLVKTMSEAPNPDKNTVACPACESENTLQSGARGPPYQCQDCDTEFDSSTGPTDVEPE